MSIQQDIYAADFENRPPMLNKDNYVSWSSRLLRDPDHQVPVAETFHEQTDEELTEKEEIWLRVQQILKGSDIRLQEKKAKTSEWYLSIHNDDRNPARANIKQALDSILQAGNPIKETLLKLSLPDYRPILTDSKMDMEVPGSSRLTRFVATCSYLTDIYKDIMKAQIEWLQAQFGDLKGKSKDTPYVSNTLDPLSQKQEDENVSLEFQVGESNALSNPVTSNLAPSTRESIIVNNKRVIALGIFRINPFKASKKTLLITHQGNNQVKDNKIDLLVQQYEQFVISEDETIDSAFARFNTMITSLKALDEGYSRKNYVKKFLRALHPKWRAMVTTIIKSKDLTSLSLDKFIRNLKVDEMIIKKDSEIVKAKGERKYLALKAKKESSD
uniref:UBN2 domain-containing protein n=1 Tax=Tanacetum cinerariifolium TaxID=118510 RepID=A0A699GNS7_TANCI|nr:UBN2 domain-containing protein [Tanacetum cinerariifolium]